MELRFRGYNETDVQVGWFNREMPTEFWYDVSLQTPARKTGKENGEYYMSVRERGG